MDKLKLFLSSRVNSEFKHLDASLTLSDLRHFLQEQLEKELFLGKEIFEVIINENSFSGDFTQNAFDNCLEKMRASNVIIILYNGEAGWSPEGIESNGICHDEFLLAVREFGGMTYAIDFSPFFELPTTGKEFLKNEAFTKDVNDYYRHIERIKAKTVEELKRKTLTQVKKYLLDAQEKAFETRKNVDGDSSVFGATLNWSKLTYSERQKQMLHFITDAFSKFTPFESVILSYHAIPDNMSVAEARNLIGRPFLHEHETIEGRTEDKGIIHIVAVHGNATELQVKSLVGYPDLTVIKGTFGYYLWEKHTHIQIFFLVKCINPATLKTRTTQVYNWLKSTREQNRILARAKARYSILKAIRQSQQTDGLS